MNEWMNEMTQVSGLFIATVIHLMRHSSEGLNNQICRILRRLQDRNVAILVKRGLCPDYIIRLFSYNNTTGEYNSRGDTWVFFGWACAARDSKLAPRSKKKFP